MRYFGRLIAVLLGGAAFGGGVNGLIWFASDYLQHPVAPGERGFWALGPGFMGQLGASIGFVEGFLIAVAAVMLRARPRWAALAGAAIGGGIWLLLGLSGGSLAVVLAALVVLAGSGIGWGAARLVRGGASS